MLSNFIVVNIHSVGVAYIRFGFCCQSLCEWSYTEQNPWRFLPAEFLSFYGLLNFYLYTLAFVYSPSKNALYGKCKQFIES